MASFLSERTVEYALVPLVQSALEQKFGRSVPLFYWKSREGNRVSSSVNDGPYFKILAMFARRPKITAREYILEGKINGELFEFSRAAMERGIPTIAGFPAISSIWKLYESLRVHWIQIEPTTEGDVVFQVRILPSSPSKLKSREFPLKTLSLDQIAETVDVLAEVYSWMMLWIFCRSLEWILAALADSWGGLEDTSQCTFWCL